MHGMDDAKTSFRRRTRLIAPLGACVALAAGCAGTERVSSDRDRPTEVSIGDFRGERDGPRREPVNPAPESRVGGDASGAQDDDGALEPGAALDPGDPGRRRASMTTRRRRTRSTPAPRIEARPARRVRTGEGLDFLDAKVGDINGRPIYVTSFFEPIEARLRSLSERESPRQWQRSMFEIVKSRLDSIIFDELLRAETLASLSPEQRVGLQSFLRNFRDDMLSQNLGSEQLANRRLQEQQGQTLDQALRQKELDTLVSLTLHNKINRRVNVSWRDIRNRYEREHERFNPPPTAVLRVIRLIGPSDEDIAAINSRLEGGEPFAEIAASDRNTFNTDEDGVHEVLIGESFETTAFFGPGALNDAVRGLEPGDWTGPIEVGNASFWIEYAERRQESTPLYEAQLTLQRELTQERRAKERAEYLSDLMKRAKVSSREEILLRLASVAQRLYGPESGEP